MCLLCVVELGSEKPTKYYQIKYSSWSTSNYDYYLPSITVQRVVVIVERVLGNEPNGVRTLLL